MHIALTGNPTEMRVMWKTQGGRCASGCWVPHIAVVLRAGAAAGEARTRAYRKISRRRLSACYIPPTRPAPLPSFAPTHSCPTLVTSGPAAALVQNPPDASLLHKHSGRQRSYSTADMCAAPAADGRWGTSFHHSAVLTGLQPGERYFYQVCWEGAVQGGGTGGSQQEEQ